MQKPPSPLTATPKPDLDWSRESAPFSREYDDIYFSVDGGLDETSEVFLKGCNFPAAWSGEKVFTIAELGFGSGLNFLAAWALWNETAKPEQRLHFISIEAYPWSCKDLERAHLAWPALKPLAEQLTSQWPGQVKGVHRLHFANVSLTLFHMGVLPALSAMKISAQAWFLDGFSPPKNPDMWSDNVYNTIAKNSAPQAKLATFTVAGHVRRGLQRAGFIPEKKTGFGRKRERLEAVYQQSSISKPGKAVQYPPVIIGGGIAGAAIARGFVRRGITPTIIDLETDLQSAASGNPAALVMPRLDLQDRPESRFFLSAYLYALTQYQDTMPALHTGIVQLAKHDDEQIRFDKLTAQRALPHGHMQAITRETAQALTELDHIHGKNGLHFPKALLIDPKRMISAWTDECQRIIDSILNITKAGKVYEIHNQKQHIIAKSDTVFICAGANVLDIINIPVRFTRGQICWGTHNSSPKTPLVYDGYAAPYKDGVLLGTTHAHVDAGQNGALYKEDTLENIQQFTNLTKMDVNANGWQSRAAVRVTTKNTLPISAPLDDGLYVMSGLGSRGFMMAPLLGEALVCDALGEPSPLCEKTKVRFGAREKS